MHPESYLFPCILPLFCLYPSSSKPNHFSPLYYRLCHLLSHTIPSLNLRTTFSDSFPKAEPQPRPLLAAWFSLDSTACCRCRCKLSCRVCLPRTEIVWYCDLPIPCLWRVCVMVFLLNSSQVYFLSGSFLVLIDIFSVFTFCCLISFGSQNCFFLLFWCCSSCLIMGYLHFFEFFPFFIVHELHINTNF